MLPWGRRRRQRAGHVEGLLLLRGAWPTLWPALGVWSTPRPDVRANLAASPRHAAGRRYSMNMASPKESMRYLCLMACRYAFMMLSRLENALTSIISVLRGTWKLVIRASTTLNS